MKTEYIAAEIRDNIGIITLNNPQTLNSINEKMLSELAFQIQDFEKDNHVKVIVLKGIEKSFAAGIDIKELAANLNKAKNVMQNMQQHFTVIRSAKKPLIAVISGFALGIGCEIALSCDIILATDNARFGMPELSIGLLPCFGGCGLLTKRVGKAIAADMILTGRALSAEEAQTAGIVSRIINDSAMVEEYTKIAQRIASLPVQTVAAAKKIIKEQSMCLSNETENLLSLNYTESEEFRQSLMNFAKKKPSGN